MGGGLLFKSLPEESLEQLELGRFQCLMIVLLGWAGTGVR